MNLQQLQTFCAVAQTGFSVSRAAEALGISQPAVSKQLKLLETSLAIELLVRRSNRVLGLTAAGEAILATARRVLQEAENLGRVTADFTERASGRLVIATTHMYARHMLRPVIKDFMAGHPGVRLALRQGIPPTIAEWVASGEADIGISSSPLDPHDELVFLPCAALGRSVFAPGKHPVLCEKRLTLKTLARYPLITMDPSLEGGRAVLSAFERAGLRPDVVLSAIDADVVKSYVEFGLGIAVLLSIAYEPSRDRRLGVIDAAHLFAPSTPSIMLRRGGYLRGFMLDFIARLAPRWERPAIEAAMRSDAAGAAAD